MNLPTFNITRSKLTILLITLQSLRVLTSICKHNMLKLTAHNFSNDVLVNLSLSESKLKQLSYKK